MAAGGVLGMADGGDLGGMGLTPMRSDIAQVVAPNTWRVIGDRMAGDEAFIPINGSARSQSILAQTAGEMGWSLARKSLGGDGASLGTVNLGPLRRALGSTVTSSGSGDVVAAIGRLRDGLQGDIDALREDVRQLQAGKGDVNIDARTYNPAAQTSAESQARALRTGRMVAGIFAALAEYEHSLINERAEAAREAARARGKQTGRPRSLTPAQTRQARQLRASGDNIADIMATLGVARSTLYRALSEQAIATP
jgi:hypothetical protein